MSKILGLDLGTNSIGWAIRDTEMGKGIEQITHKGVMIFEKGVGDGKSGEFSLAAERTKARASRKKNQRRRWRKIDLLSLLIKNNMCPLPRNDLEQWKVSRKSERTYPQSALFKNWLRLDFNNDGILDYSNPFELRTEALNRKLNPEEIGRIYYHLIQRRGYLSNRSDKAQESEQSEERGQEEESVKSKKKLGKVASAIKELEEKLDGKTIGQELFEEIKNGGRARRRKDESTNIYRLTLQTEFLQISEFQGLPAELSENIRKIIFEQRPLKSQKGLVGKCIYEKDKTRCPISHPEYELYRMWQVLNNIKYTDDERKTWHPLNSAERQLAQQKFFRKSSPSFDFSDISKTLKKQHPFRIFNYKENQAIVGCPTLAGIISVFGEERTWELRNTALKRIQWEESEKKSAQLKYPDKKLDLYDIWHWLFTMDNDKDQQIIAPKAILHLGLSEKEAANFTRISIKQGYGSLSLKAIRKINHWLEQGEKYDKAVFLANVPYLIDKKTWDTNKEELINAIQWEIEQIGQQKNIADITNSLIKRYNNLPYNHRFARREEYQLDNDDIQDVQNALINYFGDKRWDLLPEKTRFSYGQQVQSIYGNVLLKSTSSDLAFIKPPRLDVNIKNALSQILGIDPQDKILSKLYHPSEIDSFLPAVETGRSGNATGKNLLNSPRTDSIRNPMAMRTLHELRKLSNYLLKNDIIDEHTQVIVEMARELNDANRRKAIERYQRERQEENGQYSQEVRKIFTAQNKTLPADLTTYIERYRLREEQPKHVCIYTGHTISNADLFDEFTTDIEHTLPRSQTFDDSLQNKTIAFKYYNNEIKNTLLPSQLPNYSEDTNEYSAIEPRLTDWQNKVSDYETKVEISKKRSRIASTKEAKDKAIQERHYYTMHLRYWRNKLERFTITEITEGFKNSQLIDTQIIAKYGVLYLKTLFFHVRSTKGIITDKIKKIWGSMSSDEKKDRSQHTHHAADAIIQTLLYKERNKPDVYNLLAESYKEAEQNKWKEPRLPNPWNLDPGAFYGAMQQLIGDIIVYHADRNKVLKQTKKKVRLKKRIEYLTDTNGAHQTDAAGNKIPVYQQGRGIRASLHKDTFYGAIKVPVKENGKFISDKERNLILEKDENGNDLLKYRTGFVFRGNTVDAIKKNIENIVDERLKLLAKETGATTIHKQGYFEIPPSEERKKRDPQAEATKVFKVKVFAESLQNPLRVKQHVVVNHEHKRWYYAQTDGNYLMALYNSGKEKDFELINTFDLAELAGAGQGLYPFFKEKISKGKPVQIPLSRRNGKDIILTQGLKVLLFENSPEEIIADPSAKNLDDRLFKVQGLSIQRNKRPSGKIDEYGIIQLMHHLEARPLNELKIQDGEYKFKDGKKYRKMNHIQFKGLIEGIDFSITPVGTIHFT